MNNRKNFSPKEYKKKNQPRAEVIMKAVKRGVKEYDETFKRLASV